MKIDWKLVSDGPPKHTSGMILFAAKGPSLLCVVTSWQQGICQPLWTHYISILDILETLSELDPQDRITALGEPSGSNGEPGIPGSFGPNDIAYTLDSIEAIMPTLLSACVSWCGYSHSRCLTANHSLAMAVNNLETVFRENCHFANRPHDAKMFEIPAECFVAPEEFWNGNEPPSQYQEAPPSPFSPMPGDVFHMGQWHAEDHVRRNEIGEIIGTLGGFGPTGSPEKL